MSISISNNTPTAERYASYKTPSIYTSPDYKKWTNPLTSTSSSNSIFGDFGSSLNTSLYNIGADMGNAVSSLSNGLKVLASMNSYTNNYGKTAKSSNEDVLTASVSNAKSVSTLSKTSVNVTSVASSQINQGTDFSNGVNSFGSSFSLAIKDNKGKTSNFSVSLGSDDDNRSAQLSMVNQINNANIGVKATLVEDKENNTSRIQLESKETGEKNGAFTVSDNSGANLWKVSKEAESANYTVNGVKQQSETNNVKLSEGVEATLKSVGNTQISYSNDTGAIAAQVEKFVEDFNKFKDLSSTDSNTSKKLRTLTADYSSQLSKIGVDVSSNGKLSVNTDKLNGAIEDGSVAKFFKSDSYSSAGSFGDRLKTIGQNAVTSAYVNAASETNPFAALSNNTFDYFNNYGYSALFQSMNNNNMYLGLLFNATA